MGTCKEIEDLTQFKNLSKCGGGDDEVSLELLTVLIAKDFIYHLTIFSNNTIPFM